MMRSATTDALWEAWKARALDRDIVELARERWQLRKSGADWAGPCPSGCAERDGFVVTGSKQVFYCRPSGESGNIISMVMHAEQCGYADALESITGETRPDRQYDETPEEKAEREAKAREAREAREKREAAQAKALAAKRRRDEEHIEKVRARAVPITGTQAGEYLKSGRGLSPLMRHVGDLFYVEELDYWGFETEQDAIEDRRKHLLSAPAMVALVRGHDDGVVAIHETFLSADGLPEKLDVPGRYSSGDRINKAKKFRGSPVGGMIRLGRVEERMAIAEGIESALGWYSLRFPWARGWGIAAAGSLGNLYGRQAGPAHHPTRRRPDGKPTSVANGFPAEGGGGLVVPDGVREIMLLGDGDSERIETQQKLACAVRRFESLGLIVSVHMAPKGLDWADIAKARAS